MILPSLSAARRSGSCGAARSNLTTLARFQMVSCVNKRAARSAPMKFGMRPYAPGNRTTPAAVTRVHTLWRIASFVMRAEARRRRELFGYYSAARGVNSRLAESRDPRPLAGAARGRQRGAAAPHRSLLTLAGRGSCRCQTPAGDDEA